MVSTRASETSKTPHSWQNNVPKRPKTFLEVFLGISFFFIISWALEALGPLPNCRSHFSAQTRIIESFWNLQNTSFMTKQCSHLPLSVIFRSPKDPRGVGPSGSIPHVLLYFSFLRKTQGGLPPPLGPPLLTFYSFFRKTEPPGLQFPMFEFYSFRKRKQGFLNKWVPWFLDQGLIFKWFWTLGREV